MQLCEENEHSLTRLCSRVLVFSLSWRLGNPNVRPTSQSITFESSRNKCNKFHNALTRWSNKIVIYRDQTKRVVIFQDFVSKCNSHWHRGATARVRMNAYTVAV